MLSIYFACACFAMSRNGQDHRGFLQYQDFYCCAAVSCLCLCKLLLFFPESNVLLIFLAIELARKLVSLSAFSLISQNIMTLHWKQLYPKSSIKQLAEQLVVSLDGEETCTETRTISILNYKGCLLLFLKLSVRLYIKPPSLSSYRYLSSPPTIPVNLHVSVPFKLNGYHRCRMMMMLIVTNSSANRENHLQFHCKAQTRATKPQPISACLSPPCSIRLSDPVCFT